MFATDDITKLFNIKVYETLKIEGILKSCNEAVY